MTHEKLYGSGISEWSQCEEKGRGGKRSSCSHRIATVPCSWQTVLSLGQDGEGERAERCCVPTACSSIIKEDVRSPEFRISLPLLSGSRLPFRSFLHLVLFAWFAHVNPRTQISPQSPLMRDMLHCKVLLTSLCHYNVLWVVDVSPQNSPRGI